MSDVMAFRRNLRDPQFDFAQTLAFIAERYTYTPTAFQNGSVSNAAGENEGSCKTLAMAVLEGLNDDEALLCFGEYYRSVLETPQGTDHSNIRALMQSGLAGVHFDKMPLTRREV